MGVAGKRERPLDSHDKRDLVKLVAGIHKALDMDVKLGKGCRSETFLVCIRNLLQNKQVCRERSHFDLRPGKILPE
jgi:hypothetical protein